MSVNHSLIGEKHQFLEKTLREMRKVMIAFSGGVDSTLLLKVSRNVLGRESVLAVNAFSETTPAHERRDALRLAELIGCGDPVCERSGDGRSCLP